MKQCPHCHASIEDSARFCLYCMTPLEEKQAIETVPRKRVSRLVIAAAAAVTVLLIVGGVWLFFGTSPDAPSHGKAETVTTTTASMAKTTTTTVSSRTTTAKAEDLAATTAGTQTTASQQETESSTMDAVVTPMPETAPTTARPSPQTTAKTAAKTTTRSTTKATVKTTTATKSTTAKTTVKTTTTTRATTAVTGTDTYSYRAATHDDVYLDMTIAVPDDVLVITGILTRSADGIYRVPNTIDGKRVVAIGEGAFSGEDVRVVVLPDNVSTVNSHAFSNCPNLTDIYFVDSVFTYSDAFASADKRKGTLTIHCPQDCDNRNFRYYRNIASDWFDAEFREWNGGDLT